MDRCPGHIDCLLHLEHHAPSVDCMGYAIRWMRDHYFVDAVISVDELYQREYEKQASVRLMTQA